LVATIAFGQPPKAPEFVKSPSIMNIRGTAAMNMIGREVTVEGFYYDGSIPMIVDDIERVLVDMVMPPDSYIPIVGAPPRGVKNGDRISLKARLDRPTPADPASVRRESTVIRLRADTTYTMVAPSKLKFATLETFPFTINPGIRPLRQYYAVLIAGGWNAANNHIRYWNDLKAMYVILRNAGYPAANIYVIYADGVAKDASMPVNFSATTANISTVFSLLAPRVRNCDSVYIMLNDHGSPDALCLWNQTAISATAFAAEVNKIANYDKIVIQMKQCYSGSFVAPLARVCRRTVMSSCAPTEVSWAHSSLQFGEFTYWYFAALTGQKPDGSGAVNADTNSDGKIAIVEAYNFARSHDTRPETPYFDDDGVAPSHSGPMPAGGDGFRSEGIFLP
jgi:hypothetical protein